MLTVVSVVETGRWRMIADLWLIAEAGMRYQVELIRESEVPDGWY